MRLILGGETVYCMPSAEVEGSTIALTDLKQTAKLAVEVRIIRRTQIRAVSATRNLKAFRLSSCYLDRIAFA